MRGWQAQWGRPVRGAAPLLALAVAACATGGSPQTRSINLARGSAPPFHVLVERIAEMGYLVVERNDAVGHVVAERRVDNAVPYDELDILYPPGLGPLHVRVRAALVLEPGGRAAPRAASSSQTSLDANELINFLMRPWPPVDCTVAQPGRRC